MKANVVTGNADNQRSQHNNTTTGGNRTAKANRRSQAPAISGADAFKLLSPSMRKWVSLQGWDDMRRIQAQAIGALLGAGVHDVLISAGTASGKTEAAFLPALSLMEQDMEEHPDRRRVQILYVAPLKALINDQHRRMSMMAGDLSVPVVLWHGDASQSGKTRMMKEHAGVLMITPESLESLLMRRGKWCAAYLKPLVVIVDEFHSFVGEGRGKQLLSLLHRIDAICDFSKTLRPRRIGLSATLSQLDRVADILTGGRSGNCAVIDGRRYGADESDIRLTSFEPIVCGGQSGKPGRDETNHDAMARRIVEESGSKKTLTFAKSRKEVEDMSASINRICRENNIRSEAFPHHGSLSKETREALEHRLVSTDKPTMAVATVTLELGIDIGDIAEVFQINATNTVASLRQRMGRSGRRDGYRKLECLVSLSSSVESMQPELTNMIAEIELMERGWFEPPATQRRDMSVLVSEILAVLAQYGSAYDDELHRLLCDEASGAAFSNVDRDLFELLVYDMEKAGFVARDVDGTLMIGPEGEQEVDDWRFYATFQSDEAYSVRSGQKRIGEISPPDSAMHQLADGGSFLLGGRAWRTKSIDYSTKVIDVEPSSSKASFLIPISRGRGDVSGRVKRERISLLTGKSSQLVPDYIDDGAKQALTEAREYAVKHRLNGLGVMISPGGGEDSSETPEYHEARCAAGYVEDAEITVNPPVDPPVYNAISKMLESAGMEPGGLERMPLWRLADLVEGCVAQADELEAVRPSLIDDAMLSDLRGREKYNSIMSDDTLRYSYMYELFDIDGALEWFEAFKRFHDGLVDAELAVNGGRRANPVVVGRGD